MRALILAGGRGSRLGRLTESCPKPMLRVSGRPILEHLLGYAAEAGITDFLINVGYLGQRIVDYFGDGHPMGVHIEYFRVSGRSPETAVLAWRQHRPGQDLCCLCGDSVLSPRQIRHLLRAHDDAGADATFTVEVGENSAKRVAVRHGRIACSSTDPSDGVLVYNMVMRHTFLDHLRDATKNRREKAFAFTMDELAGRYVVRVADIGPFCNINRPEDIPLAEAAIRRVQQGRQ